VHGLGGQLFRQPLLRIDVHSRETPARTDGQKQNFRRVSPGDNEGAGAGRFCGQLRQFNGAPDFANDAKGMI